MCEVVQCHSHCHTPPHTHIPLFLIFAKQAEYVHLSSYCDLWFSLLTGVAVGQVVTVREAQYFSSFGENSWISAHPTESSWHLWDLFDAVMPPSHCTSTPKSFLLIKVPVISWHWKQYQSHGRKDFVIVNQFSILCFFFHSPAESSQCFVLAFLFKHLSLAVEVFKKPVVLFQRGYTHSFIS